MDCIHVPQDRDKWWPLVNMEINTQIPQNAWNFWLAEELLASHEGLCCMELVN
jgi:hypothetical protein